MASRAAAGMLLLSVAVAWALQAQAQTGAAPDPAVRVQVNDAGGPAGSGSTDSDLAKKLQNPIGDVISVPFQNNLNFGVGPHNGTQNVLNIQPVGLQAGRLMKVGALPINTLLGAYYDPIRPRYGATWQIRAQVALIF